MVLDDKFKKARANYMRYIRLRGDCANEQGARWKSFNEKLLVAEERFHELGSKINTRDAKKVAKKAPVVVKKAVTKPTKPVKKKAVTKKNVTKKKSVIKSPSLKPSVSNSTYTAEASGFVVSGDNVKAGSIWDF